MNTTTDKITETILATLNARATVVRDELLQANADRHFCATPASQGVNAVKRDDLNNELHDLQDAIQAVS